MRSSNPLFALGAMLLVIGISLVGLHPSDGAGRGKSFRGGVCTKDFSAELCYIPSNFTADSSMVVQNPAGTFDAPAGKLPANTCNHDFTTGDQNCAAEGAFRFICYFSHLAYDDPIAHPKQIGGNHLHHFYGNTLTDGNSSYASLRTTGEGTCPGGKLNRSAYWIAAMLKDNCLDGGTTTCVVSPDDVQVYYKMIRYGAVGPMWFNCNDGTQCADPTNVNCTDGTNGTHNFGAHAGLKRCQLQLPGQRFPRGMVLIEGWKSSDPNTAQEAAWKCELTKNGHSGDIQYQTLAALYTAQGGCSGDRIQMRLDSTNSRCWDGVALDSSDHRSHVYDFGPADGFGIDHCPHGMWLIPVITTVIVSWTHNNDFDTWYLSSDHFGLAPVDYHAGGFTAHFDWMPAWDEPNALLQWMAGCLGLPDNVNGTNDCSGAAMGINDKQLVNPTLPTLTNTEGSRYLRVP